MTELFDDTVLVTSTFAGEGRLFCTTLAGDLSGLLVLTDGGGVPGTVFGRVLLMTECTDAVDGDLVVYLLGVMYLGALGIRLFRGLGVSGCGIFDGVVRTDVDNVEDTFDPGEIGNFELEDWVGELVPPLELLLALALLTWLILETGLAIRGPPLTLACLAGDMDEAL